jgi:hypothetical protein
VPISAAVSQVPQPAAHTLLCLHSSAGSGAILQRQLQPLALTFSLRFLDGALVMDPAVQPEAKVLRTFFPGCLNRAYSAPQMD